jgi:hypothetical protein
VGAAVVPPPPGTASPTPTQPTVPLPSLGGRDPVER